jgi:Anti-sigma factor NepR
MSNDEHERASARRRIAQNKKGDPGKQDWIGANLRKVYDEALSEPVPDRFLALLKQIDQKEGGS